MGAGTERVGPGFRFRRPTGLLANRGLGQESLPPGIPFASHGVFVIPLHFLPDAARRERINPSLLEDHDPVALPETYKYGRISRIK